LLELREHFPAFGEAAQAYITPGSLPRVTGFEEQSVVVTVDFDRSSERFRGRIEFPTALLEAALHARADSGAGFEQPLLQVGELLLDRLRGFGGEDFGEQLALEVRRVDLEVVPEEEERRARLLVDPRLERADVARYAG